MAKATKRGKGWLVPRLRCLVWNRIWPDQGYILGLAHCRYFIRAEWDGVRWDGICLET